MFLHLKPIHKNLMKCDLKVQIVCTYMYEPIRLGLKTQDLLWHEARVNALRVSGLLINEQLLKIFLQYVCLCYGYHKGS